VSPDASPFAALCPETLRWLALGRALYNRGEHWESHEAWEQAWQEEEGEVRLLLQGLIQVAAAMHKALVQAQPASCVKLLASALQKLAGLPDDAAGLDLEGFRLQARIAQTHAQGWSAGEVPAFDRAFVPALRLRPAPSCQTP